MIEVADKFNWVDMDGIDIVKSQGIAVDGLFNRLLNSIQKCRYTLLYNWYFADISIVPTPVELVFDGEEVKINELISVTSEDIVRVYSLETPAEPVLIELIANENKTYTPESGVDGYNPVIVSVPVASNVKEQFSVNWDFSNPVNSRGQSEYSSQSLIYTIDGWQLQGGILELLEDGIRLSRINSTTAGFFMQRYNSTPTTAMVAKQFTLSAIIDDQLVYGSFTMPSDGGVTVVSSPVQIRLYNYGTEVAVTFDVAQDTELHIIKAVKMESGQTQTLAILNGDKWELAAQSDAETEYIRARMGIVKN